MSHHGAVSAALLDFLGDGVLGGRSFVAPNRLEYRGGGSGGGAGGAFAVLDGLAGVGQNNCHDARGDLVVYPSGGAGTRGSGRVVLPGVPDEPMGKIKLPPPPPQGKLRGGRATKNNCVVVSGRTECSTSV